MRRVLRPLAVFSIASGVSLAIALQFLVGGARGQDSGARGGTPFFSGYNLEKLDVVDPTIFHLAEGYVDRSRLDWDGMYIAALEAIERQVPVCMFTREPGGNLLSVEIGEFRTVLEVPEIRRSQDLQSELRKIASLLVAHLDPEQIPNPENVTHPFALVEYALINGMLSTLDPHSILLPPDDAKEMDVENQGVFGGLGITIEADPESGRLIIGCPTKGEPAYRAGIQANDQITRIDGESTINMTLDDAVRKLRGPVGDEVVLEVMRGGGNQPPPFHVVRQLISIKPVQGELVEGTDVGYIVIEAFHEKVEQRLHEELARLTREAGGKLRGLILDLRGNPGGFLNQAVRVADAFLDSGDIVSTVNGDGRQTDHERARPSSQPKYPVVVLVDSNSASASEIVAGALRFNERAVVVGERTFGKGSVQNLHPMVDSSKLKLTISRYYTPGNRSIQATGIPADIELVPAEIPEKAAGKGVDSIRLYHRERVRREADLDHSLEKSGLVLEEPAYRLRYVDTPLERPHCGELELSSDLHVQFARDLLKASRGWRRADVLVGANSVVYQYQRLADKELQNRFSRRGIDWSSGRATKAEDLEVALKLDLGKDGQLTAGEPRRVSLAVTNRSRRPLHRLVAIATDSEILGGREFIFGKVEPGQTRRFSHTVDLPAGWAAEMSSVRFELRDSSEVSIGDWTTGIKVAAQKPPVIQWRWSVSERNGNGNGKADVGEQLAIRLDVENRGGPTADPYARIRNRAGPALDPVVGTLSPGTLVAVTPERSPADCTSAKQSGCRRVLGTGEQWSGEFVVDVKEALEDGQPHEVELTLGDTEAYDHGSIARSGFFTWFSQRDSIRFVVGEALPKAEWRRPPMVEITHVPELTSPGRRVSISGVVTDDKAVRHVMVFAGQDKAFFEGSGDRGLVSLPFTADVELSPGTNVLSVLATDSDGFVSSRSAVTWFNDADLASNNR